MTFLDTAVANPGPSAFAVAVSTLRGWLASRRAARRQHLALQALLFMPELRLNDLGLSHADLARAFGR